MDRASWVRTTAAAGVALIGFPLLSGCGQRNDFVGTWKKATDPDDSISALDHMVIDKATVDFVDAHGGSTSPTATYKVVSDNEAVATGVFGMSIKLVLINHNTLATTSPNATFLRA